MTIDEHMCLKSYVMDVRDELIMRARRGDRLADCVTKLEWCLSFLCRKSVVRALTKEPVETDLMMDERRGASHGP